MENRWTTFGRVVGSLPVVIVEYGHLLEDRAKREGVTLPEILTAGRETHGLERLDQFKYTILERHGGISVVPQEKTLAHQIFLSHARGAKTKMMHSGAARERRG